MESTMADGRKFEKILEQYISFNFLKSKVCLAKTYQTELSLMSKRRGTNFIQFLYVVISILLKWEDLYKLGPVLESKAMRAPF